GDWRRASNHCTCVAGEGRPPVFPCLYGCVFNLSLVFFFFNDPATTEIYTLSLHDALPIWCSRRRGCRSGRGFRPVRGRVRTGCRSEEHTSELQSRSDLVCRLLLEKKNTNPTPCASR